MPPFTSSDQTSVKLPVELTQSIIFRLLLGPFLLLVANCSRSTDPPQAQLDIHPIHQQQEPPSGPSRAPLVANEIAVALSSEPKQLDWRKKLNHDERFVVSLLMRGLLKYQEKKLVCDLCQKYEVDSEKKNFRFWLPHKLKWSDGQALEAEHFLFALQTYVQNALGQSQSAPTSKERIQIKKQEIHVTFEHTHQSFLHWLTTPAAYPFKKDQQNKFYTLGPYLLVEWQKGQRMVLESHPGHYPRPPVHRIQITFGERKQLLEKFKKKKLRLDVLADPSTQDIIQLKNASLKVSPYWATRSLILNTKKGPTADREIRQALLFSLDRSRLPAYLGNGDRAAPHLLPPGIPGHKGRLPRVRLKEAQSARHRAADWSQWLEIQLLVRNHPTELKLASWLSEQLKQIRVNVNIRSENSDSYQESLEQGNFDLALHTFTLQTADPLELYRNFKSQAPRNYGAWSFRGYDKILKDALQEKDQDRYQQLLTQLSQLLEQTQVVIIPLTYPLRSFLLNPRVKNFAVTPFGHLNLFQIQVQK